MRFLILVRRISIQTQKYSMNMEKDGKTFHTVQLLNPLETGGVVVMTIISLFITHL